MARKKREYEDDDGRTIADMSGLDRQPMLIPRRPPGRSRPKEPEPREERQSPDPMGEELNREERRMYIWAALRAALLIALVFIVALGALIGLMVLAWR